MPFDITIGKLLTGNGGWLVLEEKHPDAPRILENVIGSNVSVGNSFGLWNKFCEESGLNTLSFKILKLDYSINDRPRTSIINAQYLEVIRMAKTARAEVNQLPAGYHIDLEDRVKAKLNWLEFWMAYSLDKYDKSAIHFGTPY